MTHEFRKALTALFAIQFFSWSAMFALWIYAAMAVAGLLALALRGSFAAADANREQW